MVRTISPVDLQVEAEVGCHVLPTTIAHKAGRRQLTHVRIDERHAECAFACHRGVR